MDRLTEKAESSNFERQWMLAPAVIFAVGVCLEVLAAYVIKFTDIVSILLWGVFFLLWLLGIWPVFFTIVKWWSRKDWIMIEGVINSAAVERKRVRRGGAYFQVKVKYSYSLNGRQYSTDVKINDRSFEGTAKKVLERVEVGAPLKVWVHPAENQVSVTALDEKTIPWEFWMLAFFLLIPVVLLVQNR